jgi:hypothetical protein
VAVSFHRSKATGFSVTQCRHSVAESDALPTGFDPFLSQQQPCGCHMHACAAQLQSSQGTQGPITARSKVSPPLPQYAPCLHTSTQVLSRAACNVSTAVPTRPSRRHQLEQTQVPLNTCHINTTPPQP